MDGKQLKVDWEGIEKHFGASPVDFMPSNVREWRGFIESYDKMVDLVNGWPKTDPSFWGITHEDAERISSNILYSNGEYKRSIQECHDCLLSEGAHAVYDGKTQTREAPVNSMLAAHGMDLRIIAIGNHILTAMVKHIVIIHPDNIFDKIMMDASRIHIDAQTQWEYLPRHISGGFQCNDLKRKDLVGCPVYIGGHEFECMRCDLESLDGAPTYVSGAFICSGNRISSLEPLCNSTTAYIIAVGNRIASVPDKINTSWIKLDDNPVAVEHGTKMLLPEYPYEYMFRSNETPF